MKTIIITLVFGFFSANLLANNLVFKTKNINESSDQQPRFTIRVNYPQIDNPSNQAEQKFNEIAKQMVIKKVNEFKKTMSSWYIDPGLSPEIKANGSTLNVHYDLSLLKPNKVISVRYRTDTYFVGAAHPSHSYSAMNYDLVNCRRLSLSDLFKPKSNYLQTIAAITTQKVTQNLNKTSDQVVIFKEGLAPTADNYAIWNLTPQGLKITLNEYQVAAYAFGPQEVIIPYQQLPHKASNSVLDR